MARTHPRVTALLVNYNGGTLLAESVDALLASPAIGPVVVVDNASSDDSLRRLASRVGESPRVTIHRNPANLGFAAAVNRALPEVETDFVLIINPDCIVGPRLLDSLLAEMDQTADAAVVGGLVLSHDGALQRATRRDYPSPSRALAPALGRPLGERGKLGRHDFDRSAAPLSALAEEVDAVSGALMLIRMAAVAEVGGMDEGYFLHCEDLDWCVRFRRSGWAVRFVPAGFAVHAKGQSTGAHPGRVRWHLHRGMARFYRKFEAHRHGAPFNALVLLGIWLRFALLTAIHPARALRGSRGSPTLTDAVRSVAARMRSFEPPRTLLVGSTSHVARHLLEAAPESGGWWLAVSRSEAPVVLDDGVVRMQSEDGTNLPAWVRQDLRHIVHLAPLWALEPYLEALADAPIERIVALSSTGVITKRGSSDEGDRRLVASLEKAEAAVRRRCDARGIALVLLRPTLIYDPGHDQNLERIARFARRTGVFPVAGEATGLRQPVHAQDVAGAVRAALRNPEAAGRCYTVSGPEALTYRQMVERIFRATGRRPRIVSIPVRPYRMALRALSQVSGTRGVSAGAAERMGEDHAFDHDAATRDLGFRPRPFLEGP